MEWCGKYQNLISALGHINFDLVGVPLRFVHVKCKFCRCMSSIPIMIIFQASDSFDKFINYFLLTLLLRVVIDLGLASHTGK